MKTNPIVLTYHPEAKVQGNFNRNIPYGTSHQDHVDYFGEFLEDLYKDLEETPSKIVMCPKTNTYYKYQNRFVFPVPVYIDHECNPYTILGIGNRKNVLLYVSICHIESLDMKPILVS
jgi:hypothetical protein